MQLTAAAVTPPAEHAARRPAGTADAAAPDAGVSCYQEETNEEIVMDAGYFEWCDDGNICTISRE